MQLNLNMITQWLPTVIGNRQWQRGMNFIGVVAVAWMLAGILSQAIASWVLPSTVKPVTPQERLRFDEESAMAGGKARYHYDVIVQRNIFDSTNKVGGLQAPKDNANANPTVVSNGPPRPTSLPLRLVGTIVSSNPKFSLATILVSGQPNAEQFGVQDRIMGQAQVTSIERNRVYLLNNGAKEYIDSDDEKQAGFASAPTAAFTPPSPATPGGAGIKEINPGKYLVDRSRVEQVMSNLNEVMTQARVVPHFENGKASGWKIFAIKPNSIYQELNLENGDIIQRINGVEVDSPAKALEMYQQLASESHISIDVVRRGAKQSFEYDIR